MGQFAKLASEFMNEGAWEGRLADQEKRLHQHVPSSAVEAQGKADSTIKSLKRIAFALGHKIRGDQLALPVSNPIVDPDEIDTPGMPGREIMINLPGTKQGWYDPSMRSKDAGIMSAVTRPLGNALQDTKADIDLALDERKEKLTRVTSDPATLPMYYPQLAMGVPKSFIEGYQKADTDAEGKVTAMLDKKLEHAKKQFEEALATEYSERRKIGSAGELIDGLAEHFLKSADGEANQALGMYLALASLLGTGSHMMAKNWVESRDPRQQRAKAVRELVNRRSMLHPPTVLVEPEEEEEPAAPPEHKIEETTPETAAF